MENNPILFFDSECLVCNASVDFILKNDRSGSILFASLQSEKAKALLSQYNFDNQDLSTVVLIANHKVYTKSSAVLQVLKIMGFPWNLGIVGFLIPKFLRDYFYTQFAARRYKWFKRKASCRILNAEERKRFVL